MIVNNNREMSQVRQGEGRIKSICKGSQIIYDGILSYQVDKAEGVCNINGFVSGQNMPYIHIPDDICLLDDNQNAAVYKIRKIDGFTNNLSIMHVIVGSKDESKKTTLIGGFPSCHQIKTAKIGDSVEQANGLFTNCEGLETVVIGKNLKTLAGFNGCKKLSSVEFNNTQATSVGQDAFRNCASLKEITLPKTITSIGTHAFRESGLSKITIGKHSESIRVSLLPGVFLDCASLKEVTILGAARFYTLDTYGRQFSGCSNLSVINYGRGKRDWELVIKDASNWDAGTGNYVVNCNEFEDENFDFLENNSKYIYPWFAPAYGSIVELEVGDVVDVTFNGSVYSDLAVFKFEADPKYYIGNAAILNSNVQSQSTDPPFLFICNYYIFDNVSEKGGATIFALNKYVGASIKIISKVSKNT